MHGELFESYGKPVGRARSQSATSISGEEFEKFSKPIGQSSRQQSIAEESLPERETGEIGESSSAKPEWIPTTAKVTEIARVFQDKLTPQRREVLAGRFKELLQTMKGDAQFRDAFQWMIGLLKYVLFN